MNSEKLEKTIAKLREDLNKDIDKKIDGLERKMDKKIDELKDGMESRQRDLESDIERLKGAYDFARVNPYGYNGNGYVAREPGPHLDSLQESRDDYENINPYY